MGRGLLITILLHLAIIYCYLQQRHAPPGTASAARTAIQWLLPLTSPTPLPAISRKQPRPPLQQQPAPMPIRDVTPLPATAPAPAPAPAVITAPAPEDIFAQAAPAPARPASAADIMLQARRDIGKIDRELRKAFPERDLLPPPDSKQARLERGINAAHEAVPPKWYEGAKMVELSTPDGENKTRSYKIITALVTYCINIAADGKKSYTNCPS